MSNFESKDTLRLSTEFLTPPSVLLTPPSVLLTLSIFEPTSTSPYFTSSNFVLRLSSFILTPEN